MAQRFRGIGNLYSLVLIGKIPKIEKFENIGVLSLVQ